MSKFKTVINSIAIATLTVGAILTVGSIVTEDKVVNQDMNPIQKGFVVQKNVNEFSFFTAKTILTKKEEDYLAAYIAACASLPFLVLESSIYLIAIVILAKNAK